MDQDNCFKNIFPNPFVNYNNRCPSNTKIISIIKRKESILLPGARPKMLNNKIKSQEIHQHYNLASDPIVPASKGHRIIHRNFAMRRFKIYPIIS